MGRTSVDIPPAPSLRDRRNFVLDKDLRGHLETNSDLLTVVTKPVSIRHIGALSAQSETPILFENVIEKPGFRILDIMLKHRGLQARALGVPEQDYLKTLAFRLRQPARGCKMVKTGPVKEVIWTGKDVDLAKLPVCQHSDSSPGPQLGCMNILRDPETGFYNSMHALTTPIGPDAAYSLFVTPHSMQILQKYRDRGINEVPIAYVIGTPPAYEIMTNFSGLHLDSWGEVEMFGTIMDQDVEMVPCETIDLNVPAHAEIVIEGIIQLEHTDETDGGPNPLMYSIPRRIPQPRVKITAITMRKDRPIYRNFQTTPETDHQVIPRLCHEAVLYNRLTEMGVKVKDVRFPTWGGAMSCILQVEGLPREGQVNDALMMMMSCPWNNAKLSVAISDDTDIDDPGAVYHALATRCDPERDMFIVPRTRGSAWDPSARPLPGEVMNRVVGKVGIDATSKARYDIKDYERAWPVGWNDVKLADVLG
jgi:UbiD family decarboxylase